MPKNNFINAATLIIILLNLNPLNEAQEWKSYMYRLNVIP
jgi:hypothetical protein